MVMDVDIQLQVVSSLSQREHEQVQYTHQKTPYNHMATFINALLMCVLCILLL